MSEYFKVYPGTWEHPVKPEDLLQSISFVFVMKGFSGLYFKTKEPIDDIVGMNCFEFAFDTDNGIYIKDGDMRFNDFMGEQITDSGADIVSFMREYMVENGFQNLIK